MRRPTQGLELKPKASGNCFIRNSPNSQYLSTYLGNYHLYIQSNYLSQVYRLQIFPGLLETQRNRLQTHTLVEPS